MGLNSTCPHAPEAPLDPVPFLVDGQLNFKTHDVGWLLSGIFTLITWCASIWLIVKHLTYYTCPPQQRHIVRMLFMPPVYSGVSFAGYLFYRQVSERDRDSERAMGLLVCAHTLPPRRARRSITRPSGTAMKRWSSPPSSTSSSNT